VVGETADTGFQVGVQKSVDATVTEAWEPITSRPELWLGEGASVDIAEGTRYDAAGSAARSGWSSPATTCG
jgi:hypothetical protein